MWRQALIALLLPTVAVGASVAYLSWPASTGAIDIENGRQIFQKRCAICHFVRADVMGHTGPNLRMIGRDAARRRDGMSGTEYLLESILDPDAFVAPSSRLGMPRNVAAGLSAQDLKDLVAFVASQGATPDFDAIARLPVKDVPPAPDQPKNVTPTQMALAEQVMREKARCLDCHSPHHRPEYRVRAPAIFGVGLRDRRQLHESIVDPDKQIVPGYASVLIELASGVRVTGRLLRRDDQKLQMLVVDDVGQAQVREFDMDDLQRDDDGQPMILTLQRSPMPAGYDQLLTQEELSAVVTLLQLLN